MKKFNRVLTIALVLMLALPVLVLTGCGINESKTYTVSVSGENCTVVGSGTYKENDVINLAAIPNDGFKFSYWRGDFSGSVSAKNPLSITVKSDMTIKAVCTAKETSTTSAIIDSVTISLSYSSYDRVSKFNYIDLGSINLKENGTSNVIINARYNRDDFDERNLMYNYGNVVCSSVDIAKMVNSSSSYYADSKFDINKDVSSNIGLLIDV